MTNTRVPTISESVDELRSPRRPGEPVESARARQDAWRRLRQEGLV